MYNYYVYYEYKEYVPNEKDQNIAILNKGEDTIFISIDNVIRKEKDIKIIKESIENITKRTVTKIFSFSYMGDNRMSLYCNGKLLRVYS